MIALEVGDNAASAPAPHFRIGSHAWAVPDRVIR